MASDKWLITVLHNQAMWLTISYENALFLILENSIWLQPIYFLAAIAFWFVKYLFPIDGDTLN